MEPESRASILNKICRELAKQFPAATFIHNGDANPATPLMVRASWNNGRTVKVVRADSPRSPVDVFLAKVIKTLGTYETRNVPTRALQV